jgi:hypothetical protein
VVETGWLVLGNLDVCHLNGLNKFRFENVAVILEHLVLPVEPLVTFSCSFPVEGQMPSEMSDPMDGCLMLRPDFEG